MEKMKRGTFLPARQGEEAGSAITGILAGGMRVRTGPASQGETQGPALLALAYDGVETTGPRISVLRVHFATYPI